MIISSNYNHQDDRHICTLVGTSISYFYTAAAALVAVEAHACFKVSKINILSAPQGGAHRITPHRDFHPIHTQPNPLIAPRHFCPYISKMENHLKIPTVEYNRIDLFRRSRRSRRSRRLIEHLSTRALKHQSTEALEHKSTGALEH